MAGRVGAEYKANDSRACRGCHQLAAEVLAKQQEMVRPIHAPTLDGRATCIDCHRASGMQRPERCSGGRPCWDRTNDQRIMSPLL
jgi:nitrate/TMAO reductase-like tetraheme cytochrome c subunit